MAELATIARPYAVAAFGHARAKGQLPQWSDTLALLVGISEDEQMQAVLGNAQLTKDEAQRALLAVCADRIDAAARNLVTLLVQNRRLDALPAIRELFEELKAEYENEVDARIESAFPLSEGQLRVLVDRLEIRTGRKVRATVSVAPELIGGVRVQVGDELWDASVRGQLDTMAVALTQ
jgi:F-type H+-transporting ATPase subunit delta